MYRVRKAGAEDLAQIYKMMNVPIREKLLISPLPQFEKYYESACAEISAGAEHFYLLEFDQQPSGIVWICKPRETCEIWGKHLHSLFYACARISFEDLAMPRLLWWVRSKNRRMLEVCRRFMIRNTGSESVFNIAEKLEFIAIDEIHYFEFLASEYPERISLMREFSVQGGNFFPVQVDKG